MLKNKVAIVTGASSGIGKAVAIALGSAGVKVTLAARRVGDLEEVEKTIKQNGGTAISVQTDVTNRQQVKRMVAETESKLGPVDILVNNAGVWYMTWMKNCLEDKWDTMIDINVKGLTNCIGAVLDGMVKRGSGHIVNMSSDSGRRATPGAAVYCGTKFYVEGLTQSMRLELKGTGVKVTSIQPGDVTLDNSSVDHCPDREGLTNCIGSVLDGMVKRGSGRIVNVSSDSGRRATPGAAVYCGSKFYVEGLTQSMRLELKGTGVKVTSIQPGDVTLDNSSVDHCPDKEAADCYTTDSFKALDPVDIANAVMYAVNQPDHVAVNELMVQPREHPF